MKILILSPFKTATTSLNCTFKNNNIDVVKTHSYEKEYHDLYSHVFVVTRNQIDTYISAFFQDIDNPEFEYYFGEKEKVLNSSTEELIEHFNKFDWKSYDHLNKEYYLKLLQDHFDVDILIDEDEKYRIETKNGMFFILLRCEYLDEVFDEICDRVKIPKIELERHNVASYKWYNEIYLKFKDKMKS